MSQTEPKLNVTEIQQEFSGFFNLIKRKKNWLIPLLVFFIALFSYILRTRNIDKLIDSTTGKYIPLAFDPFIFLRYAKELLTTGSIAVVDTLRYFPNGYEHIGEFSLLTHYVVYLFKFLHIFNSAITLEYVHVIYPALTFSFTLIFFFLLVKKLFDSRVALLATAYLAVIPILLYRTLAGFSDKEALALFLFILTFYFYVSAWMTKQKSTSIIFGLLAGLTTGLMGLTWGGVQFAFIILGLFGLVQLFLNKITNNNFYTYMSWSTLAFLIMITFSDKYSIATFTYPTYGITYLVLFAILINYLLRNYDLLHLKTKTQDKLPLGAFSFLIALILGLSFILLVRGFSFLNIIKSQLTVLTNPFAASRWGVTVAESHQPYLVDIMQALGTLYFVLFIIASIFFFYQMVKNIKKHKYKLTIFYSLFILAFFISRYSQDSIFNGTNGISLFLYLGSLTTFVLGLLTFYIYAYKKDKEAYYQLLNLNNMYILVFIWFFIKIIAARSAVRLVLLLSFITVILVAYFFITTLDYSFKQKNKFVKYLSTFIIFLLIFNPLVGGTLSNYTKNTIEVSKQLEPSYGPQWQLAMEWVRENTAEDAVFAHWWDYGYWVQTGGERATISDGGNVGGAGINYYTARNILTTPDDQEALAFMKAKGATHFLTLSDDIKKYPTYSSIGSDLENDRNSWIYPFRVNPSQTQETRENTVYLYEGTTVLDENFVYENILYPEQTSVILGFFVPITITKEGLTIAQPQVVLTYKNQRKTIPLNCLFYANERRIYNAKGLDGCLVLIPTKDGETVDPKGAALYLSRKVKDSLFARLYIYGQKNEHFKLVYTQKNEIPLSVNNGRLIGPINIWEAIIPENIEVDPKLKERGLPDPRLYYVVQR